MTDFLSARIRQRYANMDSDAPWQTVELNHSTFVDGPERFVCGRDIDDHLTATLEADAPFNPGAAVVFTSMAFDFIPPGQDATGPTPARVRIDNISGRISALMKLTITANDPVTIIYREFDPEDLTEPGYVVKGLLLKRVPIGATSATGELGWREVQLQAVSNQVYDRARFPALFVR
jgi:hypothetical protein